MRGKLLKALVVSSLLAIVLGMPLLLTSHRIRPSSARQIKPGMPMGELVELLNAEPGKYDGYDLSWYGHHEVGPRTVVWYSRHCWIAVYLDERDRVGSWIDGRSEPATWLARLLHRFAPPPVVEPISIDW